MKQLIASFAGNRVLANLLMVIILLAGVAAAMIMTREEFPSMTLDTVTVDLSWDGASPEDAEEGIALKIEEAIDGLEGIDTFTTTSSEGSVSTVVTIVDGYDVEKAYDRIKNKIDQVSTFPADADNPIVTVPTITHPVMTLGLSGNIAEKGLKELATQIKDELAARDAISQVSVTGTRDYQIRVELSEETLQAYGLTLNSVANTITNSNLNLSGGKLKTTGEVFNIRTVGKRYTGKEISDIVVLPLASGEAITLGQVATITDGFADDELDILVGGDPMVFIKIAKTELEDAITLSDDVAKYIATKSAALPEGVKLTVMKDNTQEIRTSISLLSKNGIMGLALVFAVLWLFLDTRLAIWVGMGIPISLAGGMAILWMMGYTINIVTLFGLIMVLGIVADDAIVVGEAIYVHRKAGEGPMQAAVNGVLEVGAPVLAAVATTVVVFVPLMHIGGVLGKVIVGLSVAVVACLLISLVECLILLPAHLSDLPDPNRKKTSRFALIRALNRCHNASVGSLERVAETYYRPVLKWVLSHRHVALSALAAVAFLTVGLMQGGIVKYEMFPDQDSSTIVAQLAFPEGTPYKTTQEAVARLENGIVALAEKTETLSGAPLIEQLVVISGQETDTHIGHIGSTGTHLGGIQVALLSASERGIHTQELCRAWEEEVGPIPGVEKLTFSSDSGGPGGADIAVALQGGTLEALNGAAAEVKEKLESISGVFRVRDDSAPGKNEITFSLKPEARTLGIEVKDLADQLFASYFGKVAMKIQRGNDEVEVKVSYTDAERRTFESIRQMMVATSSGARVPLDEVANIEIKPGYASITRTDKKRELTVSGDVNSAQIVASDVVAELEGGFLDSIQEKWGVQVELKGEAEEDRKNFGSLAIWFPLAVLTIYMIVATMFQSYVQPIIIMITVPFGIIGAILGHLVLGLNLSMFSIFGMVALTGVVVNDAIVLIDRINNNIKEGMPFMDAVVQGGTRRFRAVILTSVTTVGGLLPIIVETDPAAQTMVPMGVSLASGIAFATVLTLLLVPSLMLVLNDARCALFRLVKGRWPEQEEAEPAYATQEQHDEPNHPPRSVSHDMQ